MFARDGQRGELLQKYFSGGWSRWRGFDLPPGGHPIGPPTVASWARGRLDVFAVDLVTGRLLQRSFQGAWSNWRDRGLGPGGHRLVAPSATSWGNGRIDVVARDEVTDDLIHWWQTGSTWHGPQRLAGGVVGKKVPGNFMLPAPAGPEAAPTANGLPVPRPTTPPVATG